MNLRDVNIEIKAYINIIDYLLTKPNDDNIAEAKGFIDYIKEIMESYDMDKWLIAKNIHEYNVIKNTFVNEINKINSWIELYNNNDTRVNFTFKDQTEYVNNQQRYPFEKYPYLADVIVKHIRYYKNELEYNYNEFLKLNSNY